MGSSSPRFGVKINNILNHHPEKHLSCPPPSNGGCSIAMLVYQSVTSQRIFFVRDIFQLAHHFKKLASPRLPLALFPDGFFSLGRFDDFTSLFKGWIQPGFSKGFFCSFSGRALISSPSDFFGCWRFFKKIKKNLGQVVKLFNYYLCYYIL